MTQREMMKSSEDCVALQEMFPICGYFPQNASLKRMVETCGWKRLAWQ